MLIVELNEYNRDLLRRIAERNSLKTLNTVFGWRASVTETQDTYDSGYLEPWVQWVSVHTGTPASAHGIKNLGDVPGLSEEQIWETWSRQGRRSVVWGVMNGDRRTAENCLAFVPDPWTYSEPAYPEKFKYMIELPRYLAKNYLEISKLKSLRGAFGLFSTLIKYVDRSDLIRSFQFLMRGLRDFGPAHVTFIVFFEHVSAMAFKRALRDYRPDEAILFINMFAHVQHHYWQNLNGEDCPHLEYAASAIDDIFSRIFSGAPEKIKSKIGILNALSQKCTHDEPVWILHRPKNPDAFVREFGLDPISVEPLMTHDAHLKFRSPDEAVAAYEKLRRVSIKGAPMFHVERNQTDASMVFYRLDFFDEVDDETMFLDGNKTFLFKEHFVSIVQRTGKHIPQGEMLVNWGSPPPCMPNHEVFEYLTSSAA